jgi:hypothetical protein
MNSKLMEPLVIIAMAVVLLWSLLQQQYYIASGWIIE